MVKVGITGGIGSGKSTVAKVFEILGIPVYYADKEARRLMNEDVTVRQSIITQFGEESYQGGVLNRSFIASRVFSDPAQLELLNSLTHPATILHSKEWMRRQVTAYAIKEAALLFESGSNQELDFIIGVYTPLDLRIERIMKRDQITREEVQQRIDRQMNEDEKMKRCDAVIQNDEQRSIIEQVLSLHQQLLNQRH